MEQQYDELDLSQGYLIDIYKHALKAVLLKDQWLICCRNIEMIWN